MNEERELVMADFVHLHLHTEYSLLDGATKISKIADKAIECGQSAVAITDHGVMYGAVEFYNALKAKGIKPIIGCEVYVAARSRLDKDGRGDASGNHLILLCKNAEGYKNLCYMVSMSFIDGFYSKPRVDMDLIRKHSEGLIALSGCVAGKIPQLIISGSMSEAEKCAEEMREIFGDDFYLEIQNHGLDEERKVAYGIKMISEKLGIPMAATNDVHYLERSDADIQATLMCIQMNACITDGRPLGFETDEFYFKTTEEMRVLFSAFSGAAENTVKIAEKCNFDFEFDKLHLPDFTPEDGLTHKEKLRKDAYCGFERLKSLGRFDFVNHSEKDYTDRMEYELSVIDKMGFNAYFLIVSDFVAYAKRSDIPVGPGRGSGAGSLVAFCIGITDVDPIAFDLLFERFLNPERVSMPDFDIDFCYNRREEVIEYVKRKYGEDHVAQIVTFGTLAARAAVRDVGRALGMPYGRVDTIAKLIPRDVSVTLDSALNTKDLKEVYLKDSDAARLIDISRSLEGAPRHASTHAAGVVITEKPTYEYVPLSYSGTGVVTQFDMNTDAALGLVKFDFLGLRYLTVIHDTEKAVRKRIPDFDICSVPLDDEKTFKLLCDARTDGVFQLESGGMKQVLSKLLPSCLEDVIACIALYRPGPMESIDTFIARKHGKEKTVYLTEKLKDILDVSYGCIVYQEQVMQICRQLAGYSYARADIVRRAMSKKKTGAMQAEEDAFVSGCSERGIERGVAEKIFEEMVGFAKYAFNKSHATAYGVISYRTAYLKAHYPAEYFAALLTSVLDNTGKLREYIADAQKFGVKVLPPDINKSSSDFSVSDGNIRFGLLAIKNVGRIFTDAVTRERASKPFVSFDEFVSRMSGGELNRRTLESFIKCGVFDSLGVPRSALIRSYEAILDAEHTKTRNNVSGQIDFFSFGSESENIKSVYEYPDVPEFSFRELLLLERESSGMYFSGHMLDSYSKHIESLKTDRSADIISALDDSGESENSVYTDKCKVSLGGIITSVRTKITKNGDTMAFAVLDDKYAEIEIIVFARQYKEFSALLFEDNAVLVEGTASAEDGDDARIILDSVKPLKTNSEYEAQAKREASQPSEERIFIKVPNINDKRVASVIRLSALEPGNVPVIFYDESTGKYQAMKKLTVSSSEKVMEKLISYFGEANVKK